MLNKAIKIATTAHDGQFDKAGAPYIFHPLRVMMAGKSDIERICGVLHDTIEDSDITLEFLQKEGFSEEVLAVLDCLTKRRGENYDDFISRILENKTACLVKLADLHDNMDLSRISDPTDEDKARIEKYSRAVERIYDVLPMSSGLKGERIIKVDGCVTIQPFMTHDDFWHRFIRFVEHQGWYFVGVTDDVTDEEE
jgi:(p)ppGpp synthase/HD superfamily hydrolase